MIKALILFSENYSQPKMEFLGCDRLPPLTGISPQDSLKLQSLQRTKSLKFIMTKHSTAQGHTNMIRCLGENTLAHNLASLLSQKALRVKTFL